MQPSDLPPTQRTWWRTVLAAILALLLIAIAAIVVLRLTNPRPAKTISWVRTQDMPAPRGEMASTMDGYLLVVAGGIHGIGRVSRGVDVYDVRQRQWYIASPLPAGRHHAAAATLGGYVYVAGGSSSVISFKPLSDVWRFRPGYSWERAPSLPEGRVGHAMVTFGSRIYLF